MTENYYGMPMFKDGLIEEMKLQSAIKHRIIYLSEDVTDDVCFKLNYHLDRIVRMDEKSNIKEPITIVVSSFGGSVLDGLSYIARIEKMVEDGYEIISIIDGYAMSMGSQLTQVCSKRYARRYSTILYHQMSAGTSGTIAEMETKFKWFNTLEDISKKITLKHTKMTEEYYDNMKKSNTDLYLTAEEALELGIIDEIL